MKFHARLFLAPAALCCLGRLTAAQTAYGPGGLYVHPSAFVPHKGAVGLNVSWFSQKTKQAGTVEWLPVSLTYGYTEKLQVGLLYVHRRAPGESESSGGAFVKFQIRPDSLTQPAIAIAGSYLGGHIQQSSLAGVVSHHFRAGSRGLLTGHAGIQWARRADIPRSEDDVALFFGAQLHFTPEWSLVGDYGTKFRFDREATSGIGLVWSGPGGVSVGIGYVNAGRSDDNRFFIGVGYPLGGVR